MGDLHPVATTNGRYGGFFPRYSRDQGLLRDNLNRLGQGHFALRYAPRTPHDRLSGGNVICQQDTTVVATRLPFPKA